MRILKKNSHNNENKLRPGDFLRKLRGGLEGRINFFKFGLEPMSNKVFKRTKDFCTFQDNTLVEEIWQKRKKKKSTYFDQSIPENIRVNFLHKSEGVKTISDKRNYKQSLECNKTHPNSKIENKPYIKKMYKDNISTKNRMSKSLKTRSLCRNIKR